VAKKQVKGVVFCGRCGNYPLKCHLFAPSTLFVANRSGCFAIRRLAKVNGDIVRA
jgi:hypothetical protein